MLKSNKGVSRQKSIKETIFFSFMYVGIIPLVFFSAVAGLIIRSSTYTSEISSLRQISSLITKNIDLWGDENIMFVEDIASSQIVAGSQMEAIQTELKNKQAQDSNILNIMYVDLQGKVLVDSLGSKDMNISSESYFSEVCGEYSNISNLIQDKNNAFFVFSSPIKKDNKIIGYIIKKVKAEGIKKSIGKITYSSQGEVIAFNSKGNVMYCNDFDKYKNENMLSGTTGLNTAAQNALAGNFNNTPYVSQSIKGAAVYNYISSLNWGVIITIPNQDIYAGFRNVLLIAIPVILFVVAFIILLSLYILRKFVGSVDYVLEFTKEVAEGNLTVEANIGSTKEVSRIGDNLNQMVTNLKNLVVSIGDNSNVLLESSNELSGLSVTAEENSKVISQSMDEISCGSVAQAEETEQVLVKVRDLDKQLQTLIGNVSETNKELVKSEEALNKGSKETGELQESTQEQFELVSKAVVEINDLAEFVDSIDSIIEAIREISDQTGLLALNASIEAARAGEHGKGFAVVAEEVGKLANESQEATVKTSVILENIKKKADAAQKFMGSIDGGMKQQIATVEETKVIFEEITEADHRIAGNIKSVSELINYIKEFSDELLVLMETVSSGTEESVAVAEEVTAASEEQLNVVEKVKASGEDIVKVISELKVNIDKFKTE